MCRALGKLAYLVGDDGEAASGLAGPCRLDRRIEGEQVGLIGDVLDDLNHLRNVGGAFAKLMHDASRFTDVFLNGRQFLDHAGNTLIAELCGFSCFRHQFLGVPGVVGNVRDGHRNFFNGRGQRCGRLTLLFGTVHDQVCRSVHFLRSGGHIARRRGDLTDHAGQPIPHSCQGGRQASRLVAAFGIRNGNVLTQIAIAHRRQRFGHAGERRQTATGEESGDADQQHGGADQDADRDVANPPRFNGEFVDPGTGAEDPVRSLELGQRDQLGGGRAFRRGPFVIERAVLLFDHLLDEDIEFRVADLLEGLAGIFIVWVRDEGRLLQRLARCDDKGVASLADLDGFDSRFDALQDGVDTDADRDGTGDLVVVQDRFEVRHIVDAAAIDQTAIDFPFLDAFRFRAINRQGDTGLDFSFVVLQERGHAYEFVADTHHDRRVGLQQVAYLAEQVEVVVECDVAGLEDGDVRQIARGRLLFRQSNRTR